MAIAVPSFTWGNNFFRHVDKRYENLESEGRAQLALPISSLPIATAGTATAGTATTSTL